MHTMTAPKSVTEEAKRKVQDGAKSDRYKGLKHFNKVGYMGNDLKEVPRWACSDEAILKVINYQQRREAEYLQVFGLLKPSYVQETFITSKIFSKGTDATSYLDMMDERGSSKNWNDESEFATPALNRMMNFSIPDEHSLVQGKIAQSE